MRTLRHAARRLLRAPAFTVTAILTLALGIGGATAVFTVVNSVLLEPLPYPRPEQLVDLSHTIQLSGLVNIDESDATYLTYRAENHAFASLGIYKSTAVNLGAVAQSSGTEAPQRIPAALLTADVFSVLGVSAQRGRAFTDDDGRPGAPPVAMIGDDLWRHTLGGDPSVVGKRVMIDGVERSIVGILPASFRFPSAETAVWLPLEIDPSRTKSAAFDFRGIGRLRSGATVASATRDLENLLPRLPELYPGRLTAPAIQQTHMKPVVRPLRDVIVGDVSRVLWIVLGAVGVLLLVGCANVANLFVARAEGRQRELAVRRALGAGRAGVLAESLSEGLIVAAVGGVVGLALAVFGVRVLRSLGPASSIPRLADVRVDGIVLLATTAIVLLTAVLVSAIPALRSGTASLSSLLTASGGSVGGRVRHRARRALVVAQVALALVLLTAAGLLARSFERLRAVNPGFVADRALTMRMTLPDASYPESESAARMLLRALDAVTTIGGVQTAGVATKIPLDAEARQDSAVFFEDHPLTPGTIPPILQIVFVTPGYFRAMGIPVLSGRMFDAPDPSGAPASGPPSVIVSEAFARHYWKDSAIGKRIKLNPFDPWETIVGVVGSVRDESLEAPPIEVVYCPLSTMNAAGKPWTPRDIALVVRTSGDPTALAPAIRRAVHGIDPELPVYRVTPATDLLAQASARTTFTLLMLGVAAIVALTIGAVGIYGVIAYLVALRTREIGVRLALGATPADMRMFVAKQAVVDAAIGVAAGVLVAIAATRVLTSILFDVRANDPETLTVAAAVLLVTALAASWIPARRAASLDPALTLRSE